MRLGKRFRNRQAEAEAAVAPLKRLFSLLEGVEDAIHDFRLDPDAGVFDGHYENLRLRVGG